MKELENKLDEILVKKAPFQIPESGRKWIAEYAWIFALVAVILGALAFFPLLAAVGLVSTVGVAVGAGGYVLMAWLSLFVLVGTLVVTGVAVPKLKAQQKSGWLLMYYSTLFYFAYGLINAFRYSTFSTFYNLVCAVIWTTASLYVLFQVRAKFKN